MSYNRTSQPSYGLHAYQPVIVDEDCLTAEDRREALIEGIEHPCDWMTYLTQRERDPLVKPLADATLIEYPFFSTGTESSKQREQTFELARLGIYRAFAHDKYANAGRFWYGDGVPFRHS